MQGVSKKKVGGGGPGAGIIWCPFTYIYPIFLYWEYWEWNTYIVNMTWELELKYTPVIQSKHRSGIRAFDCRKTIIINVLFMHVYRIQLTCICTYRRNNVVLGKKTIFKIMYFSSVAAMYYLLLKKRVVPHIDKLGISLHPRMHRACLVCLRWIWVRSYI